MWLFTETGFVSAVASRDDPRELIVRARDRVSLEALAAATGDQILVGAGTDYPYRLICERAAFANWVVGCTEVLDYENFKDRVDETRGHEFAGALMSVWSVMFDVTDDEGRRH